MQELDSIAAGFQAALSPAPRPAACSSPDPGAAATLPALLLALRASDSSPGEPPVTVPPPGLGSSTRQRCVGGRTAARLPWVLGADPGLQGVEESMLPNPPVSAGHHSLAPGEPGFAGAPVSAALGEPVAAPVSPPAACRLRTCSDDEDMEVPLPLQKGRVCLRGRQWYLYFREHGRQHGCVPLKKEQTVKEANDSAEVVSGLCAAWLSPWRED